MIDWKVGDEGWDDAAQGWESPGVDVRRSPPAGERAHHPRLRRRAALAVIPLLLAVAAAGLVLRWRADRNVASVRAAVQSVLDQEVWALQNGNWELFESLADPQSPSSWYRELQATFVRQSRRGGFSVGITDLAMVQPDLAMVEVQVVLPDSQMRRETRAYRQMGQTWRRTMAPPGNLWLKPAIRETANLRFVFHADDAGWLVPLLPAMQELYTQILTDLNLAPLPNRRALQVVMSVQPAEFTATDGSLRYDLAPLSPTSEASDIRRELGRQLADRVMQQFYAGAGDMAFVLDGIREWEVSRWMGSTDPASDARIQELMNSRLFAPLALVRPLEPPARLGRPTAVALTETVVDYLVWRNSPEAVKLLVQNAKLYDNWPDLMQKGLELPYNEIDLGWWKFLASRYMPAAEPTSEQIRSDLEWILELETRAFETRDDQLFRSLLDPRAPSGWQTQQLGRLWRGSGDLRGPDAWVIDEWGRKGNFAWATVTPVFDSDASDSRLARDPSTFPLLRLYALVDQRWYLTSPAIAFADPPLKMRTRYFEFRYREPDAGLIPTIAQTVDSLYEQTARDLRGDDATPGQLWVEFVYDPDVYDGNGSKRGKIQLLSPQLFRFSTLDAEEWAKLNLGYQVANSLMAQVAQVAARRSDENLSLLEGIFIWEAGQWATFPELEASKAETVGAYLKLDSFPPIADGPSLLHTTVAEYVALTYGRHRLLDIVQATAQYNSLEDAIPAALGVDIDDFVAGWHAYLRQTYGSNP